LPEPYHEWSQYEQSLQTLVKAGALLSQMLDLDRCGKM
jgi:hypothetical protein